MDKQKLTKSRFDVGDIVQGRNENTKHIFTFGDIVNTALGEGIVGFYTNPEEVSIRVYVFCKDSTYNFDVKKIEFIKHFDI